MKSFKLAILTIEKPNTVSGKNSTIRRLTHGLKERGIAVQVVSSQGLTLEELAAKIGRIKPALIHAFHAYKAGRDGVWLGQRWGLPVVISLSGTDINLDLYHPSKTQDTLDALNKADFLVLPNNSYRRHLEKGFRVKTEMAVIAKSVLLPDRRIYFTRRELSMDEGDAVFLFPAGIRPVKNNLFPLEPLAELHRVHPGVKLVCLGPSLDADYAQQFLSRIQGFPWVMYQKEAPPRTMYSWYSLADVVLNCSHSEGGSNVVLEAMSLGKTVLASDVDGNRAIVTFNPEDWESSTGVLYQVKEGVDDRTCYFHDAEDFYQKARVLIEATSLRETIGANARLEIATNHRQEDEINGYLRIYRRLLSL